MSRQGLGGLEQLLLLALVRLGGESYGAALRTEILQTTGRSVTAGAIYPTLDRLETRGLLVSNYSEPRSYRGGRACRVFTLTPEGLRQLRQSWQQTSALAAGVAALAVRDHED